MENIIEKTSKMGHWEWKPSLLTWYNLKRRVYMVLMFVNNMKYLIRKGQNKW